MNRTRTFKTLATTTTFVVHIIHTCMHNAHRIYTHSKVIGDPGGCLAAAAIPQHYYFAVTSGEHTRARLSNQVPRASTFRESVHVRPLSWTPKHHKVRPTKPPQNCRASAYGTPQHGAHKHQQQQQQPITVTARCCKDLASARCG